MKTQRPCGWRSGWIFLLILMVLVGCGNRHRPTPDIAARINDVDHPYRDFEDYLQANSLGPDAGLGNSVLSRLLDRWVDEELLHHLALQESLIDEGVGTRQVIDVILSSVRSAAVNDADIGAWYRSHLEEFRREESIRMRQVLLADQEVAERVRGEWVSGVPFEEILARYSAYLEAFQGDDVELTREDLPPVLAEVIFALEPGEVGPVHEVDYGFHIFQVTRRYPASEVALAAVAGEIRAKLEAQSADQSIEHYLERARSIFEVEIYWRNVPFNYDGRYRSERGT